MLTRLLSVILFFVQLFVTGVLIAAVQVGGLVAVAELLVIIAAEVVAAISNLFVIRIRTGLSSLREVAATTVGAASSSDELSGEVPSLTTDAKESAVGSGNALAAKSDRRELEGIKKTASDRRRSASSREATARIKEFLVSTSDGRDSFGGGSGSKRWRSISGRKRSASGKDFVSGREQWLSDAGLMATCNEALAGQDNGWMLTKRESTGERELTGNKEEVGNSEFIHDDRFTTPRESFVGDERLTGDRERMRDEKFVVAGDKELIGGGGDVNAAAEPEPIVIGRHKWSVKCPSALDALDDL
jgi:hypothetical protein